MEQEGCLCSTPVRALFHRIPGTFTFRGMHDLDASADVPSQPLGHSPQPVVVLEDYAPAAPAPSHHLPFAPWTAHRAARRPREGVPVAQPALCHLLSGLSLSCLAALHLQDSRAPLRCRLETFLPVRSVYQVLLCFCVHLALCTGHLVLGFLGTSSAQPQVENHQAASWTFLQATWVKIWCSGSCCSSACWYPQTGHVRASLGPGPSQTTPHPPHPLAWPQPPHRLDTRGSLILIG